MPGILIDCLRKYQRLSQTPLESTRAPVHFLMLGGAGQAVPTIDAYDITKKWTGRRQDWSRIYAQLTIFFADRMPE